MSQLAPISFDPASALIRAAGKGAVIPPFLMGFAFGIYATNSSFWTGVMPPMCGFSQSRSFVWGSSPRLPFHQR